MDLEASVVERLKKLRQWQIEQQERLIQQQQMQREMLTQEQDCMYKALELSLQELDFEDNVMIRKAIDDREVSENALSTIYSSCNNSSDMTEKEENYPTRDIASDEDTDYIRVHNQSIANGAVKQDTFLDSAIEQSAEDIPCNMQFSKNMENTPQKKNIGNNLKFVSKKQNSEINHFLIEGVTPLPTEKNSNKNIFIDDVPIPSPKKDFHTLLEEQLRDCKTVPTDLPVDPKPKVKKPFLRKGEGLSRFRLSQDSILSKPVLRTRSASLSDNTKLNCKNGRNQESKSKNSVTKAQKTVSNTNSAQKQLSLKNVPLPRKKTRSKSESASSCIEPYTASVEKKNSKELNVSDFDTKTKKEMEEVRIFELLEEKAENSSFCSTSSAVVAFLQQSTPYKIRNGHRSMGYSGANIKQETSPLIKRSIIHRQINKYCPSTQNTAATSPRFERTNQAYFSLSNKNTECSNISTVSDSTELKNHIQQINSQKGSNEVSKTIETNEVDVSLHVRFSEYNEYKTFGLTDTSSISTESGDLKSFADDKSWNNTLTSEESDTETSILIQEPLSLSRKTHSILHKESELQKIEQRKVYNKSDYCSNAVDCSESNTSLETLHYNEIDVESSDIIQTSEDEETIFQKHCIGMSTVINNCKTAKQFAASYPKSSNTSIHEDCNMYTSNSSHQSEDVKNHSQKTDTIFKSELLKNRLLQLEKEIDIFRKENAALSKQRQLLQAERTKLSEEYANAKKQFEESKQQSENQLQEERKKIARERNALENRMRDAQEKAQQSKVERQEMQSLREELEELREELHLKESRWNAAQSRHKCQVRILKMENVKLKQELEKLQASKKSVNTKTKQKLVAQSNTKAMHQINKQLNMQNKENYKVAKESSSDCEDKIIESTVKALSSNENIKNIASSMSKNEKSVGKEESEDASYNIYKMLQNSEETLKSIAKKRNLYETLLKEATLDLTDAKEVSEHSKNTIGQTTEANDVLKYDAKYCKSINQNTNKVSSPSRQDQDRACTENQNSDLSSILIHHQQQQQQQQPADSRNDISSNDESSTKTDKQGVKEIHHSDGRVEFWYPNGNVKKIFPDQGITKTIYYNGDVRETIKDGRVKYFYASTRTWHTTMPDGLEILEFPDGQVERRSQNGIVEVSFPDGSIRVVQSDGLEKWALPDGTVVETFLNGEKVLNLPNGQREIHTKDHKRREYPDGTVKLLYPDGTQETRYANGRTRLKDKDGNLLMDSFQ